MLFSVCFWCRKLVFIHIVFLLCIGSSLAQFRRKITAPLNIPRWLVVPQRAAGYPVYLPRQPIYAAGGSSDYVNSWGDYRWNNFYDQSIIEEPERDLFYENFPAFLAGKWRPPPANKTKSLSTDLSADASPVLTDGAEESTTVEPFVEDSTASVDETTTTFGIPRPERVFLETLVAELSRRVAPMRTKSDDPIPKLADILTQSLSAFLKTDSVSQPVPDVASLNAGTGRANARLDSRTISQSDLNDERGPSDALGSLFRFDKNTEADKMLPKDMQIAKVANEISKREENVSASNSNVTRPLINRFDFRTLWGNFSVFPFQYTNNLVANLTIPTGVIKLFDFVKLLAEQSRAAALANSTPTTSAPPAIRPSILLQRPTFPNPNPAAPDALPPIANTPMSVLPSISIGVQSLKRPVIAPQSSPETAGQPEVAADTFFDTTRKPMTGAASSLPQRPMFPQSGYSNANNWYDVRYDVPNSGYGR